MPHSVRPKMSCGPESMAAGRHGECGMTPGQSKSKASFMAWVVMVGFPMVGCLSNASRPERDVLDMSVHLPYLKDGKTLKEEILLKLGEPSGRFEGERILTYRMADDENGGYSVASPQGIGGWETARYSLVMVFDDHLVLKTHNLVRVR
jgi:hypothetical protein